MGRLWIISENCISSDWLFHIFIIWNNPKVLQRHKSSLSSQSQDINPHHRKLLFTLCLTCRQALQLWTVIVKLFQVYGFIMDFLKYYCAKLTTIICKISDKTNNILALTLSAYWTTVVIHHTQYYGEKKKKPA